MSRHSGRGYLSAVDANGVPQLSHSEQVLEGRRKRRRDLKLSEDKLRAWREPGSLHGMARRRSPRPAGTAVRPNRSR